MSNLDQDDLYKLLVSLKGQYAKAQRALRDAQAEIYAKEMTINRLTNMLSGMVAANENTGEEEDVNEEWKVSLADLMTAMMAFFLVLWIINTADKGEKSQIASYYASSQPALDDAQESGVTAQSEQEKTQLPGHGSDILRIYQDMQNQLHDQLINGEVNIKKTNDRLFITLQSDYLFAQGKAELARDNVDETLEHIANVLLPDITQMKVVLVHGHTDDVPIRNMRFRDNWDLSSQRANTIVQNLIAWGLPAPKLASMGHSDTLPLRPNTTKANQAKNRRVSLEVVWDATQTDPASARTTTSGL